MWLALHNDKVYQEDMAKQITELRNTCRGNQINVLPGTANIEGDLQQELHILHVAELVEKTTLKSLLS